MGVKKIIKGRSVLLLLIIGLVLVFSYFVFLYGPFILGNVISDGLSVDYVEGEPLDGTFKFSLKNGELLPASTRVVFESGDEVREFLLADLISEDLVSGNYYVEGRDYSGNGDGFGVVGEKEIYPEVGFVLSISSDVDSGSGTVPVDVVEEIENVTEEEPEVVEDVVEEEVVEEVEEEVVEEVVDVVEEESEEIVVSALTGQVVAELETLVEGDVSALENFVYSLGSGQGVTIDSSEHDIDLRIEDGEVVVTTDYSETEEGFGEDYLGDVELSVVIDLGDLDVVFSGEGLRARLVYGDDEILSVFTGFEGDVEEETIGDEDSNENVAEEIVNDSVAEEEVNVSDEVVASVGLSEGDSQVLISEFGNVSVKTRSAKVVGARLIVKYELGEYWVVYSYDYSGKIDDKLREQMERDRANWLRDLVNKFSEEEIVSEDIGELVQDYKI